MPLGPWEAWQRERGLLTLCVLADGTSDRF